MEQSYSEASCSSINMEKVQVQPNTSGDNDSKYAGFDIETINCVAEQFTDNQISDDARLALAEDTTYRLREVLFSAAINMRQAKRNFLKVDDINAVFKRCNIESVYGPALPNWETFGDPKNYSFVPETKVNLAELATAEATFTEPGDIGINYQWLKDTSLFNHMLVDSTLNNYSEKIMKAAISNKKSLRELALKDVASNINIGPIIPHLCNFCFLILQKNITYSNLATPALELLEAVLFNPCTSFSIEEQQMTLLIYLMLENIMNATNKMLNEIYPVCRTLGRLCICWPHGSQIVIEKIKKHLPEDNPGIRLSAPVISAFTFIGNDALNTLLWPNLIQLFKFMKDMAPADCLQLRSCILIAAYLSYDQHEIDASTDLILRNEFGDSLVPYWKLNTVATKTSSEALTKDLTEKNSLRIKLALLKTRTVHSQQDLSSRTSLHKIIFRNARPPVCTNRKPIIISGFNALPVRKKCVQIDEKIYEETPKQKTSVDIIIGRRTLCTLKKVLVENDVRKTNIKDFLYM